MCTQIFTPSYVTSRGHTPNAVYIRVEV